ncbi:C40 family peptidase [Desulfotomaculum copahuensis]|uniref:Peptidoglycan endopeptidase n=1 Tax=Desulfotomaculum copahuensis TaxID=1838280 RepID=A0A1B7LIL3_9FIRM|nr:C40 family peptidase [Desulfotomaculum copahuensis]OAT86404.1 hypothetical protein A6M21_02960 [Desulfotomaculum copahuensis]
MKNKVGGNHSRAAKYLCLLWLLCLPAFPAAAAAADYTVKPGDSLYAISMHYHTTVKSLQSANGLDGSMIHPGQKLMIPEKGNNVRPAAGTGALPSPQKAPHALKADKARTADRQQTAAGANKAGGRGSAAPAEKPPASGSTGYRVQPGDSIYRIGLRFGVDEQAIMRTNSLNSTLIYPGQTLVIPGAAGGKPPGVTAPPGGSSGGAPPGGTAAPAAVSRGAAVDARTVLAEANSLLGRPYVYGAAGPSSFDCSGFTMFVFNSAGIALPHNAADQAMLGRTVDRSALEPGDLVFFGYNGSKDIEHVGIYAGNDQFIHDSSTGGVKYSSLNESYYAANYREARRLLS